MTRQEMGAKKLAQRIASLEAEVARLRGAAQNLMNGIDTGAVRLETDQDETLANALRELRAALAPKEPPDA